MKIVLPDCKTITRGAIDLSVFDKYGEVSYYDLSGYEDLPDRFEGADAIFCNKTLLNEYTLHKATNLKYIGLFATGYNNVDLDYCREKGIKVANVVGYGEITVAEFAVGVLLNLTRKIRTAQRKLKHGIVNVAEDLGTDLYGKTVGVIGTGAIGRHFARLVKAFGCHVLAYDLYPNQALVDEGTCEYTDLETI